MNWRSILSWGKDLGVHCGIADDNPVNVLTIAKSRTLSNFMEYFSDTELGMGLAARGKKSSAAVMRTLSPTG